MRGNRSFKLEFRKGSHLCGGEGAAQYVCGWGSSWRNHRHLCHCPLFGPSCLVRCSRPSTTTPRNGFPHCHEDWELARRTRRLACHRHLEARPYLTPLVREQDCLRQYRGDRGRPSVSNGYGGEGRRKGNGKKKDVNERKVRKRMWRTLSTRLTPFSLLLSRFHCCRFSRSFFRFVARAVDLPECPSAITSFPHPM